MREFSKTRITFRRKACLKTLEDNPLLFSELCWRTWLEEWKHGKTRSVCAKSAQYHRSFKRSINQWSSQGFMRLDSQITDITYGMAARLAVFTALERGQLSAPHPVHNIRLYFSGHWCSIVIIVNETLSVNMGAVFIGNIRRYSIVSLPDTDMTNAYNELSDAPWDMFYSSDFARVDQNDSIAKAERRYSANFGGNANYVESESFAPEGVAISLLHSTPGEVRPYMLSGEQIRQWD